MAWAKPAGAWAQAVEEEEAETGPILAPVAKEFEFPSLSGGPGRSDFPSLGATAGVKESKKERRKKQTMSLADFQAKLDGPKPGTFVPSARSGLGSRKPQNDDDILRNLPTTSRGKVEGEERTGERLGGSFRDYGGDRAGREDDRRRGEGDDSNSGRADASDSWGAERKFVPGGASDRGRGGFGSGGDRRDRSPRSDRGDREDRGPSRADTVDDWGASRQFVPSGPGGGGGGRPSSATGDRYGERERREYEPSRSEAREPSRADSEARWERNAAAGPTAFEERGRREEERRPGFGDSWSGARREGFRAASPAASAGSPERDNWRRGAEAGPDAGAAPAPRGKVSLAVPEAASRGAARASVFGAARPREEVLAAQQPASGAGGEPALAARVAELQARVDAGEGEQPLALAAQAGSGSEGEEKEQGPGLTVAAALEAAVAELAALRVAASVPAAAAAAEAARPASPATGPSPLRAEAATVASAADVKPSWRREEGDAPVAAGAEDGERRGPRAGPGAAANPAGGRSWTGGHFRDRQRAGAAPAGTAPSDKEAGEQPRSEARYEPRPEGRYEGRGGFRGGDRRGGDAPPRASGGW